MGLADSILSSSARVASTARAPQELAVGHSLVIQHKGAHAGHKGAHAGPAEGSLPEIGGVNVNDKAAALWEGIPKSIRDAAAKNGLNEVAVLPEKELAKAFGVIPREGWEVVGGYQPKSGKMLLLAKDNENVRRTMTHETAHALDKQGADGKFLLSESPEWLAATGWEKKGASYLPKNVTRYMLARKAAAVSDYATRAPWEDFAETFKVAVAGSPAERQSLRKKSLSRYNYMAELLKGYGLSMES